MNKQEEKQPTYSTSKQQNWQPTDKLIFDVDDAFDLADTLLKASSGKFRKRLQDIMTARLISYENLSKTKKIRKLKKLTGLSSQNATVLTNRLN